MESAKSIRKIPQNCAKKIKIGAEIDLRGLITAGVKFIFEKTEKPTTGDRAHSATGNKNSIAIAIGVNSCAKSVIGGWLVFADWKTINCKYELQEVKAVQVDGETIKENTFYKLVDGMLVEA